MADINPPRNNVQYHEDCPPGSHKVTLDIDALEEAVQTRESLTNPNWQYGTTAFNVMIGN